MSVTQEDRQLSAVVPSVLDRYTWYFLWTKLVIGVFLGLVFAAFYEALPLSRRIRYALCFWLVIQWWDVSHPLVYGTLKVHDQVFWVVYTLGGFLGYGVGLGLACRKCGDTPPDPSAKPAAPC